MKVLELKITLLDDIILSATSATTGGHSTLDYIPGANLLGAAAAKLYKNLSMEKAWQVFHSGAVRFGNAYPLMGEETAWPAPLCWHSNKGETPFQPYNLQHINDKNKLAEKQPKQVRGGYVTASSKYHSALDKKTYIKTAINPEHARAAKSQLFVYQALSAGQQFRALIQIDEAAWQDAVDLPEQLAEALNGNLRLGRSRSAQYGQVNVETQWRDENALLITESRTRKDNSIIDLWLLSDLALIDKYGQPTLIPQLSHFDLVDEFDLTGHLIADKSYLRHRRYSPYNSARGGYDQQREVICQGSVLQFKLDSALTADQQNVLNHRLRQGVGLFRECGLGQIAVNPVVLDEAFPKALKITESNPFMIKKAQTPEKPDTDLIRWLAQQQAGKEQQDNDRELAKDWLKDLEKLYRSARIFRGTPPGVALGPGRNQWGRVLELARTQHKRQEIEAALFTYRSAREKGICVQDDADWGIVGHLNGKTMSFSEWLQEQLQNEKVNDLAFTLRLLARMAQSKVSEMTVTSGEKTQ